MRATIRHLVLTGAGLVGAATATTSAISLYGIAVKCGIPQPWAVANPIALDAGAAVSALAWITQDGERRMWAKWTAVAALVASLVENGLDHALSLAEKAAAPAPLQAPLLLVLGVSACIPAMLFAVVHLAALMVRADTPSKPRVERAPRKPTPKPPAETPSVSEPPAELTERREASGTATEWARNHWPVTARQIQDATGVAKGSSHRIYNKLLAEAAS